MTIYFVAGEVSADNHGAALMCSLRELNPALKFIGRGGPQMQRVAGTQFKNWIGDAAVLGLWEVLGKYGYFRGQFHQALKEILESKPDAVVLIDYPGFNLRLARALRSRSPGQKIIYYVSPQVWAWNPGRIKRMVHSVDLVLCIFPFEADLYDQSGMRAVFVGHPMIERLQARKIDVERDPNLIGLCPGSRLREVRKISPVMIEAANLLWQKNPRLRFEIAAASDALAMELEKMILETPLPSSRGEGRVRGAASQDGARLQVKVGETTAIMQRAWAGIVASGSATLEAAYFRMPFALVYKVAWPTYFAARLVVTVKYLGMPNVLANKEVVPEFIQHRAKPSVIARTVQQLIENSEVRSRMITEFDEIVGKLGKGEASKKAAQVIIKEIGRSI